MKIQFEYRIKSLAVGLVFAVFCQYAAPPVGAQEVPPPAGLNIVIVEGEGAINNARQRVNREPIVRVEDDNHKPIAGAAVVFTLPTEGTTGVWANGSRALAVNTNSDGVAVGKGLRVNAVSGKLAILVSASYRGLTARASINQTNEGIPGAKSSTAGGGHGKLIVILAVVAAAAGGGAYYATHKSSSSSPSTPNSPSSPSATPIGISAGSSTIIGPH